MDMDAQISTASTTSRNQYWKSLPENLFPTSLAVDAITSISKYEQHSLVFIFRHEEHPSIILYQRTNNKYTLLLDLPGSEYYIGVILQNYFYIFCGVAQPYTVYRLDLTHKRKQWEKVGILQANVKQAQAIGVDKILLSNYSKSYIYDPLECELTDTPMQNSGFHDMRTIVQNDIYFLGGFDKRESNQMKISDKIDIYNISSHSWRTGPKIPIPLVAAGMTVYRDRWIILIGGNVPDENVIEECFVYDTLFQEWNKSQMGLPSPRSNHRCCIVNQDLLIIGGHELELDSSTAQGTIPFINISYILPRWCMVGHWVILRKLLENGRADFIMNGPETKEKDFFRKLFMELALDMFQVVLSFLTYE